MKQVILIFVIAVMGGCGLNGQVLEVKAPSIEVKASPDGEKTPAQEVSVCDLKNDPPKYNHASVKLTGYFSRGFEDSSLYDPACKSSSQWIWVELGGTKSVNVMYCCGVAPRPTRESELKVEGITLSLVDDKLLKEYDETLAKSKKVKATVIGTFFSGTKRQFNEEPAYYGGYGHMGSASLFVVQQVLAIESSKAGNK